MRIRRRNAHFANNQRTIQNNRALEAAFRRAGITDVASHNLRKTFATRLLNRGAAITDVQHLLGHASVKTTDKAYAAFVKNERIWTPPQLQAFRFMAVRHDCSRISGL